MVKVNQILVTKKLYITPELKRKKKIYKFDFILSIFLVCVLISLCIYAEYDRNKSEEVSQEILSNLEIPEDITIAKNKVLIVVLDDEENTQNENTKNENIQEEKPVETSNRSVQTTNQGFKYTTIATITISKLNLTYPIIDGETDSEEETEALLKISPTKFWGPEPNQVGNLCIVGHNYRNTRFFSKVPTLVNGDIIEITDLTGKTIQYKVYDKYQVDPTNLSCTSQLTNGKKEITLITCTDDSKQRVIVKATAI